MSIEQIPLGAQRPNSHERRLREWADRIGLLRDASEYLHRAHLRRLARACSEAADILEGAA